MRWLRKSLLPILFLLILLFEGQNGAAKPVSGHPAAQNNQQVNQGKPPQLIDPAFQATLIEALRSIISEGEADRRDQNSKWPPSPSWAIVYVTGVYVIIALLQLHSIGQQANIAERALTTAQRPYLRLEIGGYHMFGQRWD